MNEELLEKAKETKTMEELKALMSKNGFKMNENDVEEFYARIHSGEALSDEELEGLSGGKHFRKRWVNNTDVS